jgi:cytoskeletal protein CcmA (bactofilin family)
MWKKDEPAPAPAPTPYTPAASSPSPPPAAASTARHHEPAREQATIGASIALRGDLTGEEDLLIQGRIEGTVTLAKHTVVVGKSGNVKADIRAKSIRVEGEVLGNLYGEEEIVICVSGRVQGNVTSPRVTLENGCRFKGSIDMDAKGVREEVRGREEAKPQRPSVEQRLEVARA